MLKKLVSLLVIMSMSSGCCQKNTIVLDKNDSFEQAIVKSKPYMGRTPENSLNKGNIAFAQWVRVNNLQFSDFAVAKNMTTFEDIKKSPQKEVGKQACFDMNIEFISDKETSDVIVAFTNVAGNPKQKFSLFAFGDTVDHVIAQNATGKVFNFCGVVTGTAIRTGFLGKQEVVSMVGSFAP